MSEIAWRPGNVRDSNLDRFMREHGISSFAELRERSIRDPVWFWDKVVQFLGLEWFEPYRQVLDESRGMEWARWFVGGKLNLAHNCVDRPALLFPDRPAIVAEAEDGTTETWTYAVLKHKTDAMASLLAARGIGEGDAVGIFMPMIPETVAAFFAVAKLGAVSLPIFSGYAAAAVATRLQDAGAKALIVATECRRRTKIVPMKKVADEAVAAVPTVQTVVVVPRAAGEVRPPDRGGPAAANRRDVYFEPDASSAPFAARPVDSEHPLFIAYTSGTTGRPKGSVHVHGGFLAKIAEEVAFQFDVRPSDVLFWLTDLGWIMGPWELVGTLANGATLALYDGAPDHPGPDRIWQYVERHRVSILGVSPTLVRALMAHGDAHVTAHDLSSLRILGSTGEPWNEEPWRWFFTVVGGRRCPIINISGGTEVGACFLSCHPVEPIKPVSLGGPALGMAIDVYDDHRKPLRGGAVGELVCTRPWPGMTRGLYKDPERYLQTYFHRWPGVWIHGDWASVDDEGFWFLHGRSDDTIKIAGKRLGPAEAESALVGHPAVTEAAAVGIPDETKGEVLWAFVVLRPGIDPSDGLRAELRELVAAKLGSSFRPAAVRFTRALPKTRSAKILRRAIRAIALGQPPGDLSGLEDPGSLEAVRQAV